MASELEAAAKRVRSKYQPVDGDDTTKFDPTWIITVVQILTTLLQNCKMTPDEMPDAAKAGNHFFWRLFGKGRQARLAVQKAVTSVTFGKQSSKGLRKSSSGLVDAILAMGADSHPYEIADASKEV